MNEETETKPRPRRKVTTEKVVLPPEGVDARVRVTLDPDGNERTRSIEFHAPVQQTEHAENEIDVESENPNSEIPFKDFSFESEEESFSIPRTPLEKMFDKLRYAIEYNECEDIFFAQVVRIPDAMTSRFNVPCGTQMTLGVFQFRSTDMFSFDSAIQEKNNNSGGFFNIRIYKVDQQPLFIYRRDFSSNKTVESEVGLINYALPNPPAQPEIMNVNGQTNDSALMQYMEKTERRFEMLFERTNTPPVKSEIESMLMEKALEMVMNPPERKGFNMEETMASVMQSTVMMSSLGEALAKVINREPPAPPERNGVDLFKEVAEIPLVQQALSSVFRVSEQYAAKHLTGKTVTTADDEEYYDENENEMNELTKTLIAELESPNPLDENNETIQALQSDYPEQVKMLRTTCKTLPFDTTVVMLINLTAEMKPSPFAPFINIEETQKTGIYIFNERGMALKVRLEEFYNFVKAQN